MAAAKFLFTLVLILLASAPRVQAQAAIETARALYAAADYEKALALLDGLQGHPGDAAARDEVDLYRALCLLAVGRQGDADRAIETIVQRDPLYKPPSDLAPRMRTAFAETKKRLLPSIVQQQYQAAKMSYDAKDFAGAADGFTRMLNALNEPDLAHAASQPPLADMRTLAMGFRDLSKLATLPPPPPPPVTVTVAPPPPAASASKIYNGSEGGVIPPVAIRQEFPKFPGRVPADGVAGAIEVIINQDGAVESAMMRKPVFSSYDQMVVSAAQSWRYQPARLNGVPIKFRKQIQITIVAER
jgi:TonB family protein